MRKRTVEHTVRSKVEYLTEFQETYPGWLDRGCYNLKNFFESRTVFYPGSGADGRPLDTFNPSHSAHCYFFVDQSYSATGLEDHTGQLPTGYVVNFDKQYLPCELKREAVHSLPDNEFQRFFVPPKVIVDSSWRSYRSQDDTMLAAVDSASAMRLRIYERESGFDDAHGAKRFAIFCLGMEARTAYEWFYGIMFRGNRPFAIWLQDHGFGGDGAKNTANDRGFGDPNGRLYRAARRCGLPEYLVVKHGTSHWNGYIWTEGVDPRPSFLGHHLYKKR